LNGLLVGDFLTPDTSCDYTYPPELKEEIARVVGEYVLDVRDFRSGNKNKILGDIYEMTRKRFRLARHLLAKEDWDYFMMVEMGVDRIHHAFWDDMDPAHRFYKPGNKFETAIHDYYQEVDREIGELLAFADNATAVLVVSDHGAKRMDGGICVNEWLIANGYLALAEKPGSAVPLSKAKVDWSRTKAWGDGGYYARGFLNDTGPDGANHAENGIFLFRPADDGIPGGRRIEGLRITDIAPTVLQLFGLPVPQDMEGTALTWSFAVSPNDKNLSATISDQ